MKGWRKVTIHKNLIQWRYGVDFEAEIIKRYDKKWEFNGVVISSLRHTQKTFRTKLEALKYAKNWMKKHPRG